MRILLPYLLIMLAACSYGPTKAPTHIEITYTNKSVAPEYRVRLSYMVYNDSVVYTKHTAVDTFVKHSPLDPELFDYLTADLDGVDGVWKNEMEGAWTKTVIFYHGDKITHTLKWNDPESNPELQGLYDTIGRLFDH